MHGASLKLIPLVNLERLKWENETTPFTSKTENDPTPCTSRAKNEPTPGTSKADSSACDSRSITVLLERLGMDPTALEFLPEDVLRKMAGTTLSDSEEEDEESELKSKEPRRRIHERKIQDRRQKRKSRQATPNNPTLSLARPPATH